MTLPVASQARVGGVVHSFVPASSIVRTPIIRSDSMTPVDVTEAMRSIAAAARAGTRCEQLRVALVDGASAPRSTGDGHVAGTPGAGKSTPAVPRWVSYAVSGVVATLLGVASTDSTGTSPLGTPEATRVSLCDLVATMLDVMPHAVREATTSVHEGAGATQAAQCSATAIAVRGTAAEIRLVRDFKLLAGVLLASGHAAVAVASRWAAVHRHAAGGAWQHGLAGDVWMMAHVTSSGLQSCWARFIGAGGRKFVAASDDACGRWLGGPVPLVDATGRSVGDMLAALTQACQPPAAKTAAQPSHRAATVPDIVARLKVSRAVTVAGSSHAAGDAAAVQSDGSEPVVAKLHHLAAPQDPSDLWQCVARVVAAVMQVVEAAATEVAAVAGGTVPPLSTPAMAALGLSRPHQQRVSLFRVVADVLRYVVAVRCVVAPQVQVRLTHSHQLLPRGRDLLAGSRVGGAAGAGAASCQCGHLRCCPGPSRGG